MSFLKKFKSVKISNVLTYISLHSSEKAIQTIRYMNKKKIYNNSKSISLLKFAYENDNLLVFTYLTQYMEYDCYNVNNRLLLELASKENGYEYMKQMLKYISLLDLNTTNYLDENILLIAVKNKNFEMINLILNNFDKINLNHSDKFGNNILTYIHLNNLCDVLLKLIIINTQYINYVIDRTSSLMLLYKNKHSSLYKLISSTKDIIDYKYKDNLGMNILMHLITINTSSFNSLICDILDNNNHLIYEIDNKLHTLLHYCCIFGNNQVVMKILSLDHNMYKATTKTGKTPLFYACKCNISSGPLIALQLIKLYAQNTNIDKDILGQTPFNNIIFNNEGRHMHNVIRALCKKFYCNVNLYHNKTVFEYLCQYDEQLAINMFYREYVRFDKNAFIEACKSKFKDLLLLLLKTDKSYMLYMPKLDESIYEDVLQTLKTYPNFNEINFYINQNDVKRLIAVMEKKTLITTEKNLEEYKKIHNKKNNKEGTCVICYNDNHTYYNLDTCKHVLNMCKSCTIDLTEHSGKCPICRSTYDTLTKCFVVF